MRGWHCPAMTDQGRNYFAEWRKHRKLTQEQASELTGIPQGYLSALERGARRYNQDHLEAMATAYKCSPGDLITRSPTEPTAEVIRIWDRIDPAMRSRARDILETLTKKEG